MKDCFDIKGKVIVITGAGRGLGKSMATGLAERGAQVVAADIDASLLEALQREMQERGESCTTCITDVSSEVSIRELAAFTEKKFDRVDVLINNAGINRRGRLTEMAKEDWDATLAVNLTGSFLGLKHFAPIMKRRRQGKIINVASIMATAAAPLAGPYCASKGGVQQLTKAAALELAADNIQVNAMAPGYFATEMNDTYMKDPERAESVLRKVPMGRWGSREEVVGTAVYLSSAASDFMTGHILYVDGGYLCL